MLLKIGNELINQEAIVSVWFYPSHEVTEDDYGNEIEPYNLKATIRIVTDEMVAKIIDGYDGAVDGVTTASREFVYRGEQAENLWSYFSRISHDLTVES